MQSTLKLPELIGREHVESLSNVLVDFQNERARIESFAQELSSEWQQLCNDLAECSSSLEQDELELDKRSQAFAAKMRAASENNVRTEELERQLRTVQGEMEGYRQQLQQIQQERTAVRQQVQDVNSGVHSLSELIRVIQSTYTEIEQVQAALGQQAVDLLTSLEIRPSAPISRQTDSVKAKPVATPAPAATSTPDDSSVDDWLEESSLEFEQAEDGAEQQKPKKGDTVSDPVIGSVLKELTRLGKK